MRPLRSVWPVGRVPTPQRVAPIEVGAPASQSENGHRGILKLRNENDVFMTKVGDDKHFIWVCDVYVYGWFKTTIGWCIRISM